MVLGYGNSQYAIHGRPVWISGNRPAQATANSVMASANRLMDVRHFWLSSNKNGGNQCAGVADTDPPDEIDDGEAPADREC